MAGQPDYGGPTQPGGSVDYEKLFADLHGGKSADPKAVAAAKLAQVQRDYATTKATAESNIKANMADLDKVGNVINTVIDPRRWGGGSDQSLSDLVTGRPPKNKVRQGMAIAGGALGPLLGYGAGGIAAAGNVVSNMGRRQRGEAPVDTRAVFNAYRDAEDDLRKQITGDYPGTAFVGMLGGAKGAGGLATKGGELLAGLPGAGAVASTVKNWGPIAAAAKQAKGIKLAAQIALKPGVVEWGQNALSTAANAGLTSAAYGGLEGHTPEEHLKNAERGGIFGGLFGLGVGAVGVPAASFGSKAVKDAAGVVKNWITKDQPEGLITPADLEAAKQTVAEMARQTGLRAGDVSAKAAPFSDPLAGQMLGVQGQNAAASLARRQGTMGDQVRAIAHQRAQARPGEIKEAAGQILGVHPDEARDLVKGIVKEGRDEVGPLYRSIEESPFGVNSPALDSLLKSKTGQRVLGHVNERAKLQGLSPEGLTWAEMEKPPPPGAPQGVAPDEAPMVGNRIIQPGEAPPDLGPAPTVPIPRAPADMPSQGWALHNWLRRQGGVGGDSIGEAMLRDIARLGRRSKQNPKLVGHLADAAQEQGYFPNHEGAPPPTPDEFLDAVMNSAGGKPHYAQFPALAAGERDLGPMERWQAAEAARAQNRALESEHVNTQAESDEAFRAQQAQHATAEEEWQRAQRELEPGEERAFEPPGGEAPPPGYHGQAAPETEMVPTTGLTPRSLVLLHQLSQPHYDKFGVKLPDDANLERSDFHDALSRILLGHPETNAGALLPQYKAPLARAAAYKATQGTFKNFNGKLTGGSAADFDTLIEGMKDKSGAFVPEKLRGAQLAAANDIYELWYAGHLRGGKFLAPGVEDRLTKLFGADAAKTLVERMERTAEQHAAEARMAPFSNSSTAAMTMAGREADEGAPIAESAEVLAKKGVLPLIGDLSRKALAYRATAGTSLGYRNALGDLLRMKPAELEAMLREMEGRGPPPAKPNASKDIGKAAGAYMAPQSPF